MQSKKDLSKSIESQQNVAEELINQFNIRYNELSLIKEIGEAVSLILEPAELFRFTAESLQKHLQFKRGMIMLANPEKTKLLYKAGFGYEPDEEKVLQDSFFSLDKPHSHGVFYLTFKEQKPYIITNTEEIKKYLSEKSVSFMNRLVVNSFICVPIIYEGKSEGILAVDSSKNETLPTQSDVSLLSGIAHQIGISLNNARAHKKVKESEERFRNLSSNAPDIIYQTDNKGIITYINPAWKSVLGHDLKDIINTNITGFIREENQDEFTEIFNQIIENKKTIRDKTFTFLNSKGLPRFVAFTGTPDIDDAGNVRGVIGTLKDISRLRSMEAQLLQASKMEALGVLTGGVAHDFNNIIQAIMGYNQILIAGKNHTDADMQYLNNTRELISRSRELVQQLLLYSRKTDLTFKPLDLNEEIENMKTLLSKSVPKMIKIKTIYAKDLAPIVADSTQIGQVLMNLVINSRDAMGDEGTITISTSNFVLAEDAIMYGVNVPAGNYARILSTDTGCGMDEEIISHIFEPFFTTKEAGSGTGLGLSVVYGIVKSVRGFIFCQSEPDMGTTFEILIPSSTHVAEDAQQVEKKTKIRRGREKLLIVDDESYILETVKETLGSYGYKVLTAETTEKALDIYSSQKEKIKLVLLDLNMPGRGGKKTLADLLKINNQAKVLMTSGFSSPDQVDDLINSGAAGFLSKPYNPEELLANVRNLLDTPNQPLLF
ncbi:MAG TPA: hybrid sensor histidine kinase/response regulator [Deltaproteobacteria bacterium]|nr:hybrid sensor histidine kinase/response regulator [Deltaproteobacteria bacterium]